MSYYTRRTEYLSSWSSAYWSIVADVPGAFPPGLSEKVRHTAIASWDSGGQLMPAQITSRVQDLTVDELGEPLSNIESRASLREHPTGPELRMDSTMTPHHARSQDGDEWTVSWLPGRLVERWQAATAMLLAEEVATTHPDDRDTDWWAFHEMATEELGVTSTEAIRLIATTRPAVS